MEENNPIETLKFSETQGACYPMLPTKDIVMFPGMHATLEITHPKAKHTIEEAYAEGKKLVLFWLNNKNLPPEKEGDPDITAADLPRHGVLCDVENVVHLPKDVVRLVVTGEYRVALMDIQENEPTWRGIAVAASLEEGIPFSANECEALRELLLKDLEELELQPIRRQKILQTAAAEEDFFKLCEYLVSVLPLVLPAKQSFLDESDKGRRSTMVMRLVRDRIEIDAIRKEIESKVRERISKTQKEVILREQMRVIQEELGDDVGNSCNEYEDKVEKLQAPQGVKDHIRKQIRRVRSIPPASPDSSVLRGYIETMLDMPWDRADAENTGILQAQQCLEEDHYGLEKIKERILDYLAVRIKNGGKATTILCLAGPPGTGKTSIAASIARALGRKYVRLSLGGVHDEAEIRGHRKTYVGAMPGRIADSIKQAGVKNPVVLLDELDKLGSDFRGDPAAALLEVLDPEQNKAFVDHYLEQPLDLSQVFFVATANDVSKIPPALYDRMEILELNSYTENEKLHIAQDYLIKKQCKANGLKPEQVEMTPEALRYVMRCYTREAGVRSLERRIGEICRKLVRRELEAEQENMCFLVDEAEVKELLGKERYPFQAPATEDQIGMARGLAWTSVGGDTLEIEVGVMPGKGELRLTGKLGDVMKESAMAALSYVRSVAVSHLVAEDFFEHHDLHVHVPEGAVPKDGPSAGITLATAILSAITKRPVRGDVAMTGEITLRGRVLPIGGLKEKLLAAKNVGMQRVLVPEKNRADVEILSEEITAGLEICFVSNMSEVLSLALCGGDKKGE